MYRRLIQASSILLLLTSLGSQALAKDLPKLPDRYQPEVPSGSGGGRRDPLCPESELSMRALAPASYNRGGLTQAELTILWLYLPFDSVVIYRSRSSFR